MTGPAYELPDLCPRCGARLWWQPGHPTPHAGAHRVCRADGSRWTLTEQGETVPFREPASE